MAQIAPEYCTESSSFLNWRDAVCDVVIDLDCSMIGDEPFQGRIDFRALCDTRIIKVSATAHAVERDRCRIGRADDEFVLVSQMVKGRATILQGGREARLRPGEFAIYDSMTPYVIALTEPFTMNCLRFKRANFNRYLSDINKVTARVVPCSAGIGRIASTILLEASQELGTKCQLSARQANESVLSMIAAALNELVNGPADPVSEPQHLLMQRALRLVEDELGNDELSCDYVARKLGISHRYLRKIFADREISLSELIWENRLIEAQRKLASPCAVRQSVTTIAFACGFKDSAHFSRSFRARFGMSPREFRQLQA